jgi:hypothetical protein
MAITLPAINKADIDKMSYTEARKAVKDSGAVGTWISNANSGILKSFLKGEIDATTADNMTFGRGAAPASTSPGSETALLAAALKAAVQPQLDELRSRIDTANTTFVEAVDDLSTQIAAKTVAAAAAPAIPSTLSSDLDNLKRGFTSVSDALAKREGKIQELTDVVKEAIAKGHSGIASIIAPVVGLKPVESGSSDPTLAFLQRFCQPGNALKPVLIKGGQGSGKTFGAREWGKKFEEYIEYGFNPDTSPSDMFGFPTATTPWVDGPVARGWRLAAAGKKVFMLLDEIYRAQGAARQSMLTPLSPRVIDGKYYYALNTGRPILDPVTGVESTEEILAPRENLAIAATTNVGARFDVNSGCAAERERFAVVHVEVEETKLRAVLSAAATAKGFSPSVVDKLVEFWKECKVLAADNFLEVCPTTRILSESVLYSHDEKDLPVTLSMLGMNIWVAETLEGLPEPEQIKKVDAALKKHFPPKAK